MEQQTQAETKPNSVLSAKAVDLALVSYTDPNGEVQTQFAIVGAQNVVLLDSSKLGVGQVRTPAGSATGWLKDGILKAMGR